MKKILLLDPSFAEVKLLNSTHRQEEKQGSTENHNQNVGNYGTNKETKKKHIHNKKISRDLTKNSSLYRSAFFSNVFPFLCQFLRWNGSKKDSQYIVET